MKCTVILKGNCTLSSPLRNIRVVEAIAADVYFDKKKEFENDRAGADVYLQNHAGNSSYAVAFTEGGKKDGYYARVLVTFI